MIGKKISEITSFVLGQVIMWFSAITIIGGLTWIAVKIWTSIIHMIFWIKALNCVKKRKKRRSAVRAPLRYMYNKIIISQGE